MTPAEWHAIRARHVGASEVAALFDASPYLSRWALWQIKAGRMDPPDIAADERVMAGTHLEPAIAAWAAAKWGMDLRKPAGYCHHPAVAGMGCTLDFETEEDGARIPVEVKNVDGLIFRRDWIAEAGEIVEPPLHIALQLQAQMACTGAPHAWIVAAVGGNSLWRGRIARRSKTIAMIEREVRAFWRSIEEGAEPAPDYGRDGAALAALCGESDGRTVDLSGDNRIQELCAEYLAAAAEESAARQRKEAAKAEILHKLGTAERAIAGAYTISAKTVPAKAVAYVRASYRGFRLHQKQEETAE